MGADVKYDNDFEAIKTEIGKSSGIDYSLIDEKSRIILKGKSKDVRAMAYLGLVLLRDEKWEELADLFEGLASLVEKDHDGLHPQRPPAKHAAFKWLSEPRVTDVATAKTPAEKDYGHIVRLSAAFVKLQPVLDQKYPGGSPFPSALQAQAQKWEKACKPKQKAEQALAAAAGPAQQEAMATPKDAQTLVRKAARFLIEKEPGKPMGCRLMRAVRWDLLEKAPPAEAGKTQMAGPNAQQRAYLHGLLAQQDWKTLFDKSEDAFGAGANHLWLDLQRYSVIACRNLGEAYTALPAMLLAELSLLIKRVPELKDLSFSDGTPMCDAATKEWLGAEVTAAGAAAPTTKAAAGPTDKIEEEREQVATLAAAGKIERALDLLQGAIRSSTSEEDNFRRSVALGSLLLQAKQPDIAISVLESLDEKIDHYHLDRWNPALATDAWVALAQAYKAGRVQKAQNVQGIITEKHNSILRKISQIDPLKAFEINK